MKPEAEKIIIERAKTDPLAFGELYDLYYSPIFNYVLRRVGNVTEAADITSDAFFKVMRNIKKFEWRGIAFSSWIYKVTTNEVNSYFRTKRFAFLSLNALSENRGFDPKADIDLQEDCIHAQNQLERHEDFLQLRGLIKRLPNKYQEVIVLRFFENKKISEISEITGKNTNTVKSLLSRGINMLRIAMQDRKKDVNSSQIVKPFSKVRVVETEGKNYDNKSD